MSKLINSFRQLMGKDKGLGVESTWAPTYSTGIKVMDYINGKIDLGEVTTGVDGGKILYIIGKSGTGKSTLGIQIGTYIVSQYEDSYMIHDDFERASEMTRIKAVTGWDEETLSNKYIHVDKGLSTESFYKQIKALAKLKLEHYDELKIDTGRVDRFGKPIFVLPPHVVLLDSLALVAPEKQEEGEELSGQMAATAIAKANTQTFKRIMSSLEDANIILIVINHITTKVDINPMAKTAADVNYLKQDETLPGGKAPVYLANTMIKLVHGKKLKPEETYGVHGFTVIGELIKSRSAAAGRTFTMVYDPVNGFDDILSSIELIKDMKLLKGNGNGYYIESCPNVKFKLKTFKETYLSNPALQEAFDALVHEVLKDTIPTPDKSDLEAASALNAEQEEDTPLFEDPETGYWTDGQGNYYDDDGNPVELE